MAIFTHLVSHLAFQLLFNDEKRSKTEFTFHISSMKKKNYSVGIVCGFPKSKKRGEKKINGLLEFVGGYWMGKRWKFVFCFIKFLSSLASLKINQSSLSFNEYWILFYSSHLVYFFSSMMMLWEGIEFDQFPFFFFCFTLDIKWFYFLFSLQKSSKEFFLSNFCVSCWWWWKWNESKMCF